MGLFDLLLKKTKKKIGPQGNMRDFRLAFRNFRISNRDVSQIIRELERQGKIKRNKKNRIIFI